MVTISVTRGASRIGSHVVDIFIPAGCLSMSLESFHACHGNKPQKTTIFHRTAEMIA